MVQREDRIHRIGQTADSCHILRPYINNTIDVGIRNIYMDRLEEANCYFSFGDNPTIYKMVEFEEDNAFSQTGTNPWIRGSNYSENSGLRATGQLYTKKLMWRHVNHVKLKVVVIMLVKELVEFFILEE